MNPALDDDLAALQEARTLVARAVPAAQAFARFEPAEAWRIAERVCRACEDRAEHYARLAVEETRIGRVEDKLFKNLLASRDLMAFHRRSVLGGVQVDEERRMLLIGRPAGVVMGLVASTSPIATLYFKVLSCLMTRNAIILSPHPLALRCSIDAAEYLRDVAREAGAPADAIQIQAAPTLDATHAMMRNPGVNLILATGGTPMVRAAYSSGTPSLGVGPGNVPVYVDASADLAIAVDETMAAKAFDHGSACSTPSAVFVHRDAERVFTERMKRAGAFYCNAEQQQRLEAFAFPEGRLNPKIVGRSAAWIAEQAGLSGASQAKVLVGMLNEVSRASPMAKEKLSPILGVKRVDDREHAIREARAMLAVSGAGHTSGIFAEDLETIALWGSALDVNRTIVNKGTSMGVIGAGTGLAPTFTIGTGFAGRSSIAENVGPEHLINWKKIAFPIGAAAARGEAAAPSQRTSDAQDDPIRDTVRAILALALESRTLP
ncbi:aldehyde dehydrogenase family protein [Variovorax sp. PBL-E5]|uniref:aldehyde dehydrogenase family protein n=1 Tax=Variovorax sp. PBL-E5 TaxID=434014 RepID=UPI001315B11D|nr:aldehyde dehydrogenase family protein [Variovorax sp. PBL-E5]VTU38398.1 Aldehyde-alcohol dehydrogenase [Variovorax sp. PBL-E5]